MAQKSDMGLTSMTWNYKTWRKQYYLLLCLIKLINGTHLKQSLSTYRVLGIYFFYTQLCFLASDHDCWWFEGDFRYFCEVIIGKKHCGRKKIDHGHPCRTQFTLMSLYSTEITITHDFWNTNSLGWTPLCIGTLDGLSISCSETPPTWFQKLQNMRVISKYCPGDANPQLA